MRLTEVYGFDNAMASAETRFGFEEPHLPVKRWLQRLKLFKLSIIHLNMPRYCGVKAAKNRDEEKEDQYHHR